MLSILNFEWKMKYENRQLNLCSSSGKTECFAIQLDERSQLKTENRKRNARHDIVQLINSMNDKLIFVSFPQIMIIKPHSAPNRNRSRNPILRIQHPESRIRCSRNRIIQYTFDIYLIWFSDFQTV